MAIHIRAQKDYLVTESSLDVPCNLTELNELLAEVGGTGSRIVAMYSVGRMMSVNVEQRTKVPDSVADEVRRIVGVNTKEINGDK